MSGVLLLDAYDRSAHAIAQATHLPVVWASYGHPFKGDDQSNTLFRDPREYSTVLSDPFNVRQNWEVERRPYVERNARYLDALAKWHRGNARGGPPKRDGLPLSDEPFATSKLERRLAFASQTRPYLAATLALGRLIIVFVGTQQAAGEYEAFVPTSPGPIEHRSVDGPALVEFDYGDQDFGPRIREYAKRFAPSMSWSAAWGEGGRRHTLFRNVSGHCVGFAEEFDNLRHPSQPPGLLIALPNIASIDERTKAMIDLVEHVLPRMRPLLFARPWVETYEPAELAARRRVLEERAQRVSHELIELDREAGQLSEFRPLVVLTGDDLQALVVRAFRDVFGCSMVDLDAEAPAGQRGADLLVDFGGVRVLVEITGSERTTLQQEKVNKFKRNVARHEKVLGRFNARLLLVNGQTKLPPAERNGFASEPLASAQEAGIVVRSTVEFFDVIERRRAGALDEAAFARWLDGSPM